MKLAITLAVEQTEREQGDLIKIYKYLKLTTKVPFDNHTYRSTGFVTIFYSCEVFNKYLLHSAVTYNEKH